MHCNDNTNHLINNNLVIIIINYNRNIYLGNLKNEEEVLEWLISVESMDLPDRIEEVNAKILQNYIDEHDYVAVLFCE